MYLLSIWCQFTNLKPNEEVKSRMYVTTAAIEKIVSYRIQEWIVIILKMSSSNKIKIECNAI